MQQSIISGVVDPSPGLSAARFFRGDMIDVGRQVVHPVMASSPEVGFTTQAAWQNKSRDTQDSQDWARITWARWL